MSDFQREERYIVFKIKNMYQSDLDILECIKSNSGQAVECVVTEEDWIIYDLVWDLIQATVERPDEIEGLVDQFRAALNEGK